MTRACKRCGCTDATTWVAPTRHTVMCGPCWRATEPLHVETAAPVEKAHKPHKPQPVASLSLDIADEASCRA